MGAEAARSAMRRAGKWFFSGLLGYLARLTEHISIFGVCIVVASFVWLAVLGQWFWGLWGLLVVTQAAMWAPVVLSVVLMPSLLPDLLLRRVLSTGRHTAIHALGWSLATLYTLTIAFAWCFGMLSLALWIEPTPSTLIPVLLLSSVLAVGPWGHLAYMEGKAGDDTAGHLSSVGIVLFLLLGYGIAMVVIARGNHSLRSTAVVLGVSLAVAFLQSAVLFLPALWSEMHQPEPETPVDGPGEPEDRCGPSDSQPPRETQTGR